MPVPVNKREEQPQSAIRSLAPHLSVAHAFETHATHQHAALPRHVSMPAHASSCTAGWYFDARGDAGAIH